MGIGDFFKNIFGKKVCSFCGSECGVMSRTKIKGDDYICNDCAIQCSMYIRKCDFTKEQLEEHMDYMKRSDRLYRGVISKSENKNVRCYPGGITNQGIAFYDDYGMFRIMDKSKMNNERYPVELFRYDQIASYEPYIEEREPTEPGKPKEFLGGGLVITLVGAKDSTGFVKNGTRAHPYITQKIKICFTKRASEKESQLQYLENAMAHLDHIFGVHSDRKGLFQFGMSEKEKRDVKAGAAMLNTFAAAVRAAKNGADTVSEEQQAAIKENMAAIEDAVTNGLGVYSRRADEAEECVK